MLCQVWALQKAGPRVRKSSPGPEIKRPPHRPCKDGGHRGRQQRGGSQICSAGLPNHQGATLERSIQGRVRDKPDLITNRVLCSKSQADHLMVQVFKGGDLEGSVEYKGPRDADGIVSYLRKQAGPAYVVLKGETEVCSQSLMP